MNVESFLHHEKSIFELYPDIENVKITNAKHYLGLMADGAVHSVGMSREDAKEELKMLKNGTLPPYAVEGHAANYMDYINKIERN